MRLHEITNAPGDYLPADSEVDEMMDELLQTLGKLRLMPRSSAKTMNRRARRRTQIPPRPAGTSNARRIKLKVATRHVSRWPATRSCSNASVCIPEAPIPGSHMPSIGKRIAQCPAQLGVGRPYDESGWERRGGVAT